MLSIGAEGGPQVAAASGSLLSVAFDDLSLLRCAVNSDGRPVACARSGATARAPSLLEDPRQVSVETGAAATPMGASAVAFHGRFALVGLRSRRVLVCAARSVQREQPGGFQGMVSASRAAVASRDAPRAFDAAVEAVHAGSATAAAVDSEEAGQLRVLAECAVPGTPSDIRVSADGALVIVQCAAAAGSARQ